MPRKEAFVTIDETGGRDAGRCYKLTEMSAHQGEDWGWRVALALGKSGVQMPDGFLQGGWAAIAYLGIRALMGMPWELAKPLLDEMMQCVAFVPDPNKPSVVRPLIESDIEEVATRLRLRDEVVQLHVGFSIAAKLFPSTSTEPAATTNSGSADRLN